MQVKDFLKTLLITQKIYISQNRECLYVGYPDYCDKYLDKEIKYSYADIVKGTYHDEDITIIKMVLV